MQDITKESSKGFKALIVDRVREWRDDHDDNARFRTADNVAMVKRQRGDYFGRFDEEWLNSNHQFALVWKPGISRGFFTYPVIPRSIRAKIATEMATELKFTIEPVYKSPELEAVCEKLEKIASYIRRINFDSQTTHDLSYLRQTGKCAFIYSNFDKDDGVNVPVPNMAYRPFVDGQAGYVCKACQNPSTPEELGFQNPLEVVQTSLDTAFQARSEIINTGKALTGQDSPATVNKDTGTKSETEAEATPDPVAAGDEFLKLQIAEASGLVEDLSTEKCPKCHTVGALEAAHQYQIKQELAPDGTIGYKNTGMLKTKIVSALQMRIDEYNCLGFKIHNGHFIIYTVLMPLYEVLQMCGDDEKLKEKIRTVAPDQWSDAIRWHYELSKSAGNRSPFANTQSNSLRNALVPVEFVWIRPVACGGDWVEPNGEKIGKFTIKKGESIQKAFERQYNEFKGVCVQMVGDEILKVWNDDFRAHWNGVPWKVDPHSGYPQGEENLLFIQDAATRIFTMVYSFSQRRSAPKGVANPLLFRKSDLEANITGGWIFPKIDNPDTAYENLKNHIFMLEGGDLPASTQTLIDMVIAVTKETSGIYDETVGAANNTNETASGRATALNQSLSLQVPENRTKGDAFVDWFYTALELVQKNAEDTFYRLFADDGEEEWTEADLIALRAVNIRREVRIAVIEGTDIPKTREDMEEAYLAAMEIGLFDPMNPTPIDIKAELLKIRGIDYDLDDFEKTKRLAKRRYNQLKAIVSSFDASQAIVFVPDPMAQASGDPAASMATIPMLHPELEAIIRNDPATQIREVLDNHFLYIKYYKEKMFGLLSKQQIDAVFVFAVQTMIAQHRGFIARALAQQTAIQTAAGATQNAADNAPGLREEQESREDTPQNAE